MGREVAMLNDDVDRYVSLRHALGYPRYIFGGVLLVRLAWIYTRAPEQATGSRNSPCPPPLPTLPCGHIEPGASRYATQRPR